MGWAYCGQDERGRDIGYGVEAVCDVPGCSEVIDRGLAYCCGGMHGDNDNGCGGYFCEKHLSPHERHDCKWPNGVYDDKPTTSSP